MSMQPDWDVFQYVLNDPTLDRQAFEERMLQDESIAWAVADAVEVVERLRAASHFMDKDQLLASHSALQPVRTENELVRSAWSASAGKRSALAALAAAGLLMVGWSSYVLLQSSGRPTSSRSDQLALRTSVGVPTQALAEFWLALDAHGDTQADSGEVTQVTWGDESESRWNNGEGNQASTELNAESVAEEKDWLIEAASLFYAEGAAS